MAREWRWSDFVPRRPLVSLPPAIDLWLVAAILVLIIVIIVNIIVLLITLNE